MHYYAPRFGMTPDDWISGRVIWAGDTTYLEDLDKLVGAERAWLVFAHHNNGDVRSNMVRRMDSLGTRLDSISFPKRPQGSGAEAYLFDLRGRRSSD